MPCHAQKPSLPRRPHAAEKPPLQSTNYRSKSAPQGLESHAPHAVTMNATMSQKISPAQNGPFAKHPMPVPHQEAATPIAINRMSDPHAPLHRVHPLAVEPPGQTIAQNSRDPSADEPLPTHRRADPSETAPSAEPLATPQIALPSRPATTSETIATAEIPVSLTNAPHHVEKRPPTGTVLAPHHPTAHGERPHRCPADDQGATDRAEQRTVLRRSRFRKNPPQPRRKKAGMHGISRSDDVSHQSPQRALGVLATAHPRLSCRRRSF